MAKQDVYLGRIESIGGQQLLSGWLSAKHPLRHMDLALFTAAVSTAVLGCIAIYSATRPSLVALGRDPNFYLKRQLAFLALAMVVFIITLLFDYRQLRGLAPLIYLGPDLGTVLVLVFLAFSIVVVAGAKLRWIGLLVALSVGVFVLVLHLGLLHDYQIKRLTAFLDQSSKSTDAYNLQQSRTAVASGGLTGKGLFRGTQTNLDYVPENHTDFIFTVVGEETGFAGSLLLIGLFSFLVWRALRIAMMSKDQFGARLAAGVGAMLAFQLFVNVGMTIGIVPVVGIPLPFVSYGGSSLLTSFCAVGI